MSVWPHPFLARPVAAAALVGFGVSVLTVWSAVYHAQEARVVAAVVGVVTPTRLYRTEWLVTGPGRGMWFVVNPTCTSSLLLLPLLGLAAVTSMMPRISLYRSLVALTAGAITVVLLNTARLAMIGLSWRAWGNPSLWVTHDLIGSVVSVVAVGAGLAVQVFVTGEWGGTAGRRFEPQPGAT